MYDELMPVKVKTGDNTNTALLFGLIGLSLLGLGLFKFRKRKN